MFVCGALKSPLGSKAQASPSGGVIFVLLCKLEPKWKLPKYIVLEIRTLKLSWVKGEKRTLSKNVMKFNSRGAGDPSHIGEGLVFHRT